MLGIGLSIPDISAGSAGIVSPAVITDGLVGWWPLDADNVDWDGGLAIDVIGGKNGAISNIAHTFPLTWNASNSKIQIDADDAHALSSFSLVIPVQLNGFTSNWSTVLEHDRFDDNWYALVKSGNGAGNRFNYRTGFFNADDGGTGLETGKSYFLTLTYDENTGAAIFYVNGKPDDQYAAGPPDPTAGAITIGINNFDGECLDGFIPYPGLKIYNRALSADEVGRLYRSFASPTPIPVYLDTDISDNDDMGVLYSVLLLEKMGYYSLKCVTTSCQEDAGAPLVAAVLKLFGRESVPVGAWQGDGISGTVDQEVLDRFGTIPGDTRANYPAALGVLQTAIGAAGAGGYILCTGGKQNMAALIAASSALVASKITAIVDQGGDYPSGSGVGNFPQDPAATKVMFDNSPVEIISVPVADPPGAGSPDWANGETDPYKFYLECMSDGDTDAFDGAGWDIVTSLIPIFPPDTATYFEFGGRHGTNTINPSTGANSWTDTGTGNSSWITYNDDSDLTRAFYGMIAAMTRPPE